jgi:dTDP-4-amino-4,6-dideoxygalactose transaminase
MNSWPHFTAKCRKDVDRVLRSGKLTAYRANPQVGVGPQKGSEAYGFERGIEEKFKVKHAIAVNSGTAALHAGLVALGVRGREVITTPFSFSATASAILLAGGIPRFADVDPETFCLDPKEVKRAITKRTAAILPVSLFGYFPDYSDLLDFELPIVEDGCQSVGARRTIQGRDVWSGTFGAVGVGSCNGSKNIPAGEGGFITTNSDKIAEKARLLVNHGCNFGWDQVGYNYRMTEITACIARHGLKDLEERNQRRRELVFTLSTMDQDWQDCGYAWSVNEDHVYYVVPFIVKRNRSRFISRCAKRGLPIQESYTTPLHHLRAFRKYQRCPLPVVEEVNKRLCLITTFTPDRPLSYAKRVARIVGESLE